MGERPRPPIARLSVRIDCLSVRIDCLSVSIDCLSAHITCLSVCITCLSVCITCLSARITCLSERITCLSEHIICLSVHIACLSVRIAYLSVHIARISVTIALLLIVISPPSLAPEPMSGRFYRWWRRINPCLSGWLTNPDQRRGAEDAKQQEPVFSAFLRVLCPSALMLPVPFSVLARNRIGRDQSGVGANSAACDWFHPTPKFTEQALPGLGRTRPRGQHSWPATEIRFTPSFLPSVFSAKTRAPFDLRSG